MSDEEPSLALLKAIFPQLPERMIVDVLNGTHGNCEMATESLLLIAQGEAPPVTRPPAPQHRGRYQGNSFHLLKEDFKVMNSLKICRL